MFNFMSLSRIGNETLAGTFRILYEVVINNNFTSLGYLVHGATKPYDHSATIEVYILEFLFLQYQRIEVKLFSRMLISVPQATIRSSIWRRLNCKSWI